MALLNLNTVVENRVDQLKPLLDDLSIEDTGYFLRSLIAIPFFTYLNQLVWDELDGRDYPGRSESGLIRRVIEELPPAKEIWRRYVKSLDLDNADEDAINYAINFCIDGYLKERTD